LATQRLDEGRLRGLESHLSYRVCLKTFSANESRAVIGTPDAFNLPAQPGAAYLRTGSEEPLAFQTAYVSAPYVTAPRDTRGSDTGAVQVFTAAPMGAAVTRDRVATGRTVLETVLDRFAGRGAPAHRVWLPPLSQSPTLDALLSVGVVGALCAPVGVVDRPFDQRREPLLADVGGAAGNVAVIGAPQSGKSMTVRTIVTALAATHSPNEIQFYCLDFGGGSLSSLLPLPHVGAVAGRGESDLMRRTVAEVAAVLRARETVFRGLSIDSIQEYRRRRRNGDPEVADDPFGDVFLVVDGWAGLREDFEPLEAVITTLAAQGLSFGVHVMVTASRWAEIRPAMKDQIGTRIELRLGDPGDSELNRKAAQHVPHRPGRGITHDGHHMLIALPRLDGKPRPTGLPAAIGEVARGLRTRFGDAAAPAVRMLPARLAYAALLAAHPASTQVVLGIDEDELAAATIDFGEHQHVLIVGDNECGKTATLRLICAELVRTATAEQAQLIIVDYRRTLLGAVESEHLAGYVVSGAVLGERLTEVVARLRTRIPGPDVSQQQLRTRSWWSGPDLYLIVDDYDLVATSAGNPLNQLTELLSHAKDLGLHLIVARRSGGAGRALFEPMLSRLRELGCAGLMMSACPGEGTLLGASRPGPMPAGRARLITRAGERVVQLAWVPPCP
jgi:S-DNA-T family DNA segregation ATPase FtsK/SpoIIIE